MGIRNVAETKEEEKPPQTVKESFIKNSSQQASVSSAKRNKRYRDTCSEQNIVSLESILIKFPTIISSFLGFVRK